jgi:chaperonin GroES
MLKPMEDKVVVKTIKEEQTTASGFVLASIGDEKPQEAIVVAVGPGLMLGNGQMVVPDVNVGDRVLFSKYQGTEVSNDGEDYLVLAYRDIFAILN